MNYQILDTIDIRGNCSPRKCLAAGVRHPATRGGLGHADRQPEIVEAWKDMRFGMFVCWGPVSVTGLEIGWSRGKAWPHQQQGGAGETPAEVYDNLYKTWQPDAV